MSRNASAASTHIALRQRREIEWPSACDWLTPSERARLDSFSSSRRRESFLTGRWLLRELLASVHGGTPHEHAADIDAQGRSRVASGYVNLSHSGDWCVAAWAAAPVGIDVECLRPRRDLLGIAERVMGSDALARLTALEGEAQLEAFYREWTLREAWLKARGEGLDFAAMRALHFEPAAAGADADSGSAVVAEAGLVLAVHAAPGAALPPQADGRILSWQLLRTRGHGAHARDH